MHRRFSENQFLELCRESLATISLANRAREVLESKGAGAFDGLGHFLDAVLPDDMDKVARIAASLELSTEHLRRLRASRLDPMSLNDEQLALLGHVVGVSRIYFEQLVMIDHARFEPFSRGVTARAQNPQENDRLASLRAAWDHVDSFGGSSL